MKDQVGKLENSLEGAFKGAPKIPDNGRKAIVNWLPWLALIAGVLQLMATWSLWRSGRRANELISGINEFARAFGVKDTAPELNVFYWVALVFLGVSAVMLLMAYPGLKARKKDGWNWLFYGTLVNLAYGVVTMFFDNYYGGGASRLVWSLIGAVIGFWILFQIRGSYTGSGSATK